MQRLRLGAEDAVPGAVVVRVAGELNRATAPRLARLLDSRLDHLLELARTDRVDTVDRRLHLIVDLAEVGTYGAGGLSVLRHAQYTAAQADIELHLTGLQAQAGLVPGWAAGLLDRPGGVPSTADALAAALRLDLADKSLPSDRSDQEWPSTVRRSAAAPLEPLVRIPAPRGEREPSTRAGTPIS